jgi:DNA polymerase-1
MALIFDIETNGLMPDVSTIWVLMTEDTVTGEQKQYSDHDPDLPPFNEGLAALSEAAILVGHNIIGYDFVVLKKLVGWVPNPKTVIYDTWIMSQTLRWKRGHMHGLAGWGAKLGFPKLNWDDWSKYSKEMLTYGIRDVELNAKVYAVLVEEARSTIRINPMFKKGLWVEMEFAKIESDIRALGWRFNEERARVLLDEMEQSMLAIEAEVNPQIGMVCVAVDKRDEYKETIFKKNGDYALSTCRWFDLPADDATVGSRTVDGDYCRIEFEQGKLSSDKVLKTWLYSIGWEPDDWNVKKVGREFVRTSPMLTESSLSKLGPIGMRVSEYGTVSNRHGVLKGWLKEIEYDGRLHGRMWTIGTPTFRCRHEVIANLPKVQTTREGAFISGYPGGYGFDMRSLLLPREGWVVVGADSAGNQMRGLCHDIDNEAFTNEVIAGDVHRRNADVLAPFMKPGLTPKEERDIAKPFLYAFLFGAGPPKVASILCGLKDKKVGEAAIAKFSDSIPGLGELKTGLETQFNKSKDRFGEENAHIRAIDGRIIFVKSKHQVLNYRLQTTEGITCKAAAVYFRDEANKRGLPFNFLLHYHDEFAFECPPEHAEELKLLAIEAFTQAPKWFGVECMNGDAHVGNNYAEVH